MAYACTPSPDLIDDLVQEVFLELKSKQERWSFTDPKQTRHLLATLTQQVAKRLWQNQRRNRPDHLARIADRLYQKPDTSEKLYEEDRTERLLRAMTRLKQSDQTLLRQYYLEQKTTEELATKLGLTEDHVRRNLSRAREKLRTKFEETH